MKENIEEDIKIVKKLLLHFESILLDDESMAIENILSDYKRVLEENEELKYKYDTFVKMSSEVIDNSIPKQKVKDEIEYINKFEEDLYKKENIIQVLQELLEEKGE